MNRLLYVAGFANPQTSANRVADRLAQHFGFEVSDGIGLGNALADPDKVRRAAKEATMVVTHSAGFLALQGVSTKEIHAFNAPLPSPRWLQVVRTVLRGLNERDLNQVNAPLRVDSGFLGEVRLNPSRHLGPFLDGRISRFDAIQAAINAQKAGVSVGMGYMKRDAYFHPSSDQLAQARENSVLVVLLEGVHDELVMRPEDTMDTYLEAIKAL